MSLWIRLRILLIACFVAGSTAKVINTEAGSSYLTKIYVGVAQATSWISDLAFVTKEPRPPTKVKLALVGLGRTGSTSFSHALKHLGYSTIHDDEAPEAADVYNAMMKGTMSLDEVNVALGDRGFDAPMVSLPKYVEWAAVAPDVKVIITVRDPKKWAESWLSVTPAAFFPYSRPLSWIQALQDLADFNWAVMVEVPTQNRPELYQDIPTLEAGYDAWLQFVRNTVPADRLLEFDVKQGWGPLCKFLGKPVPSIPFPHINDRVVVDTIIKVFILLTWTWPVVFAAPFLILYCCIRICCCGKSVDKSKKKA